jgi:hypothetical protein
MDADVAVRVRELCHQVSVEQNAEKLVVLVREINRLVAERVSHVQAQRDSTN